MQVKCVIAATSASGSPDFGFCIVEVTKKQYDEGLHYETAKQWAADHDYEKPFVVFDMNDGPSFLFERFVWESASVVQCVEE